MSKDKHDIQLLITSTGTAEKTIFQEMAELIGDITSLLDNIMRMYMSSAKRPMPTPSFLIHWAPVIYHYLQQVVTVVL